MPTVSGSVLNPAQRAASHALSPRYRMSTQIQLLSNDCKPLSRPVVSDKEPGLGNAGRHAAGDTPQPDADGDGEGQHVRLLAILCLCGFATSR
jgi:hypothetical protein